MSGMVENYLGIPLQSQKIVPGNTATAIAASVYRYIEYEIGYDSGDYAFVTGDVIVGATSGAVGIVISYTVTAGTILGGDGAGKVRYKSWNGTNWTNNEQIKVGADNDVGDINGSVPVAVMTDYEYKGAVAKHLLLSARTFTALLAIDGSTPDQTYLLGHWVTSGSSYVIHDAREMKQARVIDAAAGSASTVVVTAYF